MRVGVITPVLPWPLNRGNRVRIFNMLDELSARHDVRLCAFLSREDDAVSVADCRDALRALNVESDLIEMPNRTLLGRISGRAGLMRATRAGLMFAEFAYNRPSLLRAASAFLATGRPDCLLVNYWTTAEAVIANCGLPRVCDTHDVITENAARLAGVDLESAGVEALPNAIGALAERERAALDSYDGLVCVTERDRRLLTSVLGVATPSVAVATVRQRTPLVWRSPANDGRPAQRLLFYGALQSPMNEQAAERAVAIVGELAGRRPGLRLQIAGSAATTRVRALAELPFVDWLGEVADLEALLHGADALFLPLSIGSGIKGRVLEAMEAGLPVVGTTIAAEGLPVSDREMAIADDDARLVVVVEQLLDDHARRVALSRAARRLAEDRYSWQNTYGQIHASLAAAVARHGASR